MAQPKTPKGYIPVNVEGDVEVYIYQPTDPRIKSRLMTTSRLSGMAAHGRRRGSDIVKPPPRPQTTAATCSAADPLAVVNDRTGRTDYHPPLLPTNPHYRPHTPPPPAISR